PAVFSADRPGFDVIIGNPPYRNGVEGRTRFDARCRAYFRRKYVAARGAIDASILFQELGLRLLADGGWTALLVPNKFLAAPFGQAFRHLALEQAELRVLADYAQAKVFPGVATYPVAYVLQKTATPRAEYDLYTERHARRDRAIVCSESRVVRMRPEQWETWTPAFSRNAGLLEQLERRGACIAEHFRVTASATAGEAYLLRPFLKDGRPRGRAYRFVTTGIIDRYGDRLGRVPLRYLKASYRHPYLPADCHALTANRRRQYAAEKLIVAGLARRLKATWDDGATAGAVSTVQVWHYSPRKAASLMYLLALLNSRLLTWVFRQHFAALSLAGGYMRIGLRQISALPLPCLDLAGRRGQAAHDQLERLAVRMIGLHARLVAAATPRARASLPGRIDATDREIDRRVYALYGLTAKQVQLVEQETATPTATGQPAVGA
ncbi:MAG: Eco57I restriction-modification methylase domain-containing protein, partial [Planctomycetes bacterium]|nr:Eco57I restriction-modification methylase domain-containing protein [Planctomycetota bacterium]